MNLSLTPEWQSFIEKEVNSGLYSSASEVVRAALRLLRERQGLRLPELPATREELEAQLIESIDRLDGGEGIEGKESLRRLRKRIEEFGPDA